MEPRSLQWVAGVAGGRRVRGAEADRVCRVVTDSRQAAAGDLFVALAGVRSDGHDHLADAVAAGVAAVMVSRPVGIVLPAAVGVVEVADTRIALGRMAAAYRGEFHPVVVAVGGSNGKTTSKDLLAALLGTAGPTLRSPASFNNDLGVPLTLLGLEDRHRFAVLEVGTNHPGELDPLLRWIRPDHGWITSIGREHLEHFGDLDGVVAEEGVLGGHVPGTGMLVLPGDSPHAAALAARTSARVVRVGIGEGLDWSAEVLGGDWSGMDFRVAGPVSGWAGPWRVPLPGVHSVRNAVGALALAAGLGVDPAAAREALAAFRPPAGRMNRRMAGGVRLLDDTYNANADSVRAAIETFSGLPCAGRRVAVLGDMAELGRHTETAHGEVGTLAAGRVDALFAVGRHSPLVRDAAQRAGLGESRAFADTTAVVDALAGYLRPGDTVLVKASRSSRLEEVVTALEHRLGTGGEG